MPVQFVQPPELADEFRFELLDWVGEGTTASVWRAKDRRTGHLVALKVARDRASSEAIAHEAETLLLADSPLIPSVISLGIVPNGASSLPPGFAYVALRWVPGVRLDPLSIEPKHRAVVATAVARDIAAALDDLHQAGLSHGDVKPDNILIEDRGDGFRAVLVDLGYSTGLASQELRGATLRYAPPELAGGECHAAAHDLWSLGVCLAEIADAAIARDDDPVGRIWSSSLPGPVGGWARALTARNPSARPSAAWLRDAAHPTSSGSQLGARRVRASYLRVRQRALWSVRGAARLRVEDGVAPWLVEGVGVIRSAHALRGGGSTEQEVTLGPMDAAGRKRWLVALVGAAAASWPVREALLSVSEAKLATALERLASRVVPTRWTLQDVVRSLENDLPTTPSREVLDADPVELALALVRRPASPFVLSMAEGLSRRGVLSSRHALLLADALRSVGEMGRALAVLEGRNQPDAAVLRAEVLRRMGRLDEAIDQAKQACEGSDEPARYERARATWARALFDRGDATGALDVLQRLASAEASEVRALCALRLGDAAAALDAVEAGLAVCTDDESRARLTCVRGYEAHARGQSKEAHASFAQAAEHAARAGAIIEEATYRTGLAAAAVDAGRPAVALEAAARAGLLWEHLQQPGKAAYASLARAGAFALVGACRDALRETERAMANARTASDRRAIVFIAMVQCDVLARDGEQARHAALVALEALGSEPSIDDRIRVSARLLRVEALAEQQVRDIDCDADSAQAGATAQADWWSERARAWLRGVRIGRDADVLSRLMRLVREPLPIGVKGPAVDAARALAARAGDGDATRLLASLQVKLSLDLLEHVPAWLREHAAGLPWILEAHGRGDAVVTADQARNLETLVRSLEGRESLRRLLDRALDALVLWTGVERGVLLLRSPNDRLVVRAARNLERRDLQGEQLDLSHSLARRALSTGEPVVAVDAAGELAGVHRSVHALGLRSVLAVPLVAKGEALGVAYLDDRIRKGAFGPQELAWVRLVAGIAATAIADARSQLLLQRQARRARRTEDRVKEDLAEREAALDVAERQLAQTRPRRGFDSIVGDSGPVRSMLAIVERVAGTSLPVLVEGESGSGKELVARALHDHSPRASQAFVTENCSAIPEPLFESTLFGHVRGAFTGADRRRLGLFEIADGGTLFLDEVGEIPMRLQSKLLRVLQDGEVHPLGSPHSKRVDVRVIAATNRDLRDLVAAGTFREDLLYRLNVISIPVPSLRERAEDVTALVHHFVEKHGKGRVVKVSRAAWAKLESYPWPGNIRQLENEVRRALALCDDVIGAEDLSATVRGPTTKGPSAKGMDLRSRVDELERSLVTEALARTGGNQTQAAKLLGVSRFGLQKMIKRLGVA